MRRFSRSRASALWVDQESKKCIEHDCVMTSASPNVISRIILTKSACKESPCVKVALFLGIICMRTSLCISRFICALCVLRACRAVRVRIRIERCCVRLGSVVQNNRARSLVQCLFFVFLSPAQHARSRCGREPQKKELSK